MASRTLLALTVAWSAAVGAVCADAKAVEVAVAAHDGRVLRGAVDSRTDDARLWIRRDEGGVSLATSMAWDDVVAAEVDGGAVEPSALKEQSVDLATAAVPLSEQPARALPTVALTPTATRAPRIHSLVVVDVCLANLDHDVEPDGLTLTVAALDEFNRPTPIRGNLAVRLFGQRQSNRRSDVVFGELDRWTESVTPAQFVDGVATFELRFRRTAPEWQLDLLPDATIEVRLGAYGEGNFAASAPVVLRPFNPLRDWHQLYEGTRFLPQEGHGRATRSMPTRDAGLWTLWPYSN
jgi:hypothetical protein